MTGVKQVGAGGINRVEQICDTGQQRKSKFIGV